SGRSAETANEAVTADEDRAAATAVAQRHGEGHETAVRKHHLLDRRAQILQPLRRRQIEARQVRTKQLILRSRQFGEKSAAVGWWDGRHFILVPSPCCRSPAGGSCDRYRVRAGSF